MSKKGEGKKGSNKDNEGNKTEGLSKKINEGNKKRKKTKP
jgi:hypothetical protein